MASIINALTGGGGVAITGDTSGNLALQTNNGTTAVTLDTSQNATFVGYANMPNTFGFKNRIINGAMMIDQRNAGAAQTGLNSSGYFFCDRFRTGGGTWSTLRFTLQQVTDAPTGFIKSGKFTVTTAQSAGAADNLSCTHIIEGNNITDLNWGTANAAAVTLSFWVKSSATGTFGVIIGNDSNWYYPATYTISAANTWEQKTITITGPTSGTWSSTNTSGIRIDFGLGIGSNSSGGTANAWTSTYAFTSSSSSITGTLNVTWQVTGVQLEKGSTATSFDYRPYTNELQLCQRYYYQLTGNTAPIGSGYNRSTSIFYAYCALPVAMRATPTLNAPNSAAYFSVEYGTSGSANVSTLTAYIGTTTTYFVTGTPATSITAGSGCVVFTNNSSSYLGFNAEL